MLVRGEAALEAVDVAGQVGTVDVGLAAGNSLAQGVVDEYVLQY